MKLTKILLIGFLLSFCSLLGSRAYADADPLGDVESYPVPTGRNAHGITQGPDGNIWFTQEHSLHKKVWRFDPELHAFDPQAAFTSYNVSGLPGQIINGPDNSVWFTMREKVGKLTMNGILGEYTLPPEGSRTFVASHLTTGPDGRIWVFAYDGGTTSSSVGLRIFIFNPNGSFYKKVTVSNEHSSATTITTDYANRRVWYTYITTDYPNPSVSTVGYYDLDSGTSTDWVAPLDSVSDGTVLPDGKFWMVGDSNKIANVDVSGAFSSPYTLPIPSGDIFRVTQDAEGSIWGTVPNIGKVVRIDPSNLQNFFISDLLPGGSSSRPAYTTPGIDGNIWFTQSNTSNRITKIGTGIDGSIMNMDEDGDGLSKVQELQLGTSDFNPDTSGDGISDFVGSLFDPNREALFCGSVICAYPDPLAKNVYVEVDWMPGFSVNQSKVTPIRDTFADKGIKAYFDTGQLGGGNQVPYNSAINFFSTIGAIDLYDYKYGGDGISAQFDAARNGIWRYMLLGNRYNEHPSSSGGAIVGGSDSFVSYGLIQSDPSSFNYSDFDTAIAGTMIHELGHNLCLSPVSIYSGQSALCIYNGIDNPNSPFSNYQSSMNYTYQMSMVDYSSGSNGTPNDHDDWAGVNVGISDFATSMPQLFNQETTRDKTWSQDIRSRLIRSVNKGEAEFLVDKSGSLWDILQRN